MLPSSTTQQRQESLSSKYARAPTAGHVFPTGKPRLATNLLCKPDALVGLRKSSSLGRSLEAATSKPRGYYLHEATTPLISAQLLDAPGAAQPSPTTLCGERTGALRGRLTI